MRRFRPVSLLVLIALSCGGGAAFAQKPQRPQKQGDPWFLAVSHRIDLNGRIGGLVQPRDPSADAKVIGGSRYVTNLTSGVLVDAEGHVVTRLVNLDPNNPDQDLKVTTSTGRIMTATFLGLDGPTGLVVLSVPELRGARPAPVGGGSRLKVDDKVTILSPEYDLPRITIPVERVALYPTIRAVEGRVAISDLPPALTRSGVAYLVEAKGLASASDLSVVETPAGQVVGVVRYVTPGRGQIITVPFLRDAVTRRVIQSRGSVAAGWLGAEGLSIRDVPQPNRPTGVDAEGVLVESISAKGPAENAGLQRNDLIVSFDELEVHGTTDLALAVSATPAGTPVALKVMRGGQYITLRPVLGGRPLVAGLGPTMLSPERESLLMRTQIAQLQAQLATTTDPAQRERLRAQIARLGGDPDAPAKAEDFPTALSLDEGIVVQRLTAQMAKSYGVAGGVQILEVQSGTPAEKAGLRAGDLIVRAGTTDVADSQALANAIRAAAESGAATVDLSIQRDHAPLTLALPLEKGKLPRKQ